MGGYVLQVLGADPALAPAAQSEAALRQAAARLRELEREALSGPDAQALNDLVRQSLRRMPFYARDWRLGHVACDAAGCHWTWLTETGALRHLAARLGRDLGELEAKQDGRVAASHSDHPEQDALSPPAQTWARRVPGARNHFIELCQRVRKFAAHCTLQDAQPVQFENSALLPAGQLYSQGHFSVRAPLAASDFVAAWLTEGWIQPEQLRLDFSDMDNPSWTLEGRYVIR